MVMALLLQQAGDKPDGPGVLAQQFHNFSVIVNTVLDVAGVRLRVFGGVVRDKQGAHGW
jgi:hypothetical protein